MKNVNIRAEWQKLSDEDYQLVAQPSDAILGYTNKIKTGKWETRLFGGYECQYFEDLKEAQANVERQLGASE